MLKFFRVTVPVSKIMKHAKEFFWGNETFQKKISGPDGGQGNEVKNFMGLKKIRSLITIAIMFSIGDVYFLCCVC